MQKKLPRYLVKVASSQVKQCLTDLETVYKYKIDDMTYIQATDMHVIENHDDHSELTLITCDETGEGRSIVKASFLKKIPTEKTNQSIIKVMDKK